MDAERFNKELGDSSSKFNKMGSDDATKLQQIDEKIEAARGNSEQGVVGYPFA